MNQHADAAASLSDALKLGRATDWQQAGEGERRDELSDAGRR